MRQFRSTKSMHTSNEQQASIGRYIRHTRRGIKPRYPTLESKSKNSNQNHAHPTHETRQHYPDRPITSSHTSYHHGPQCGPSGLTSRRIKCIADVHARSCREYDRSEPCSWSLEVQLDRLACGGCTLTFGSKKEVAKESVGGRGRGRRK